MFASRFLLASLLFTSACALEEEDIWMPPSGSGKADGVQILPAANIPSQHVDPTKHYLTSRKIQSLIDVGALTGDPASVAMRADGIIANLPANGRLDAAELVRMEDPSIFATLFPNEQAALPMLWPLLVAPAPNAAPVMVPSHTLDVTEQRTPPSGLVPPTSIAIATLQAQWQTVARRVQLVFNADADAQTIQIADIDQVLTNPQAFTPAEVEQLEAIRDEFRLRATSACSAVLVVPEPGHKATNAHVGALSLDFTSDLVIHERRTFGSSWTATLALENTLTSTVTATANDAIILVALDNSNEHVLRGATNALPSLGAGQVVVERYVNGQRAETNLIAMPAFAAGALNSDLNQFLGYSLVLANQTPLVKNVKATSINGSRIADFHFELTAGPNLGDAGVLASVADPGITLPTGHYEITIPGLGNHLMDIYPNGVVFADGGRLLPILINYATPAKGYGRSSYPYNWQFTPSMPHFHYWQPNRESGVTVTTAMRTM